MVAKLWEKMCFPNSDCKREPWRTMLEPGQRIRKGGGMVQEVGGEKEERSGAEDREGCGHHFLHCRASVCRSGVYSVRFFFSSYILLVSLA